MTDPAYQIFLGGGGDAEQAAALDSAFFAEVRRRGARRCLYLPNAMSPDRHDSCREWFTSIYGHIFSDIDMASDPEGIAASGHTYDALYLGGGNTGVLLDALHSSGLGDVVTAHVKSGALIYGGSAGAIVLGETILTAPPHEHSPISNSGLNIVPRTAILPHYVDTAARVSGQYLARRLGIRVWGIPEESGICIDEHGNSVALGATMCAEFSPDGALTSLVPIDTPDS